MIIVYEKHPVTYKRKMELRELHGKSVRILDEIFNPEKVSQTSLEVDTREDAVILEAPRRGRPPKALENDANN